MESRTRLRVRLMSAETQTPTLHIRLDETLHAQLTLIASIEGKAINAVARDALARYVGTFADRQTELLAAIDRDAETKREQIRGLAGTLE